MNIKDYHNSPRPQPNGKRALTFQDIRAIEIEQFNRGYDVAVKDAQTKKAHDQLMRANDTAPAAWGVR